MRKYSLLAAAFALAAIGGPVHAATTVFATTVTGTSGNVILPANALGAADGSLATILRVAGGSVLTLQMSMATSGLDTIIAGQRLTANSNVQVAIGEVVGGIATFSTLVTLPSGLGASHTMDFSAACALISATGCSLLQIRVGGAPGSGFTLDGVSGVAAAPEPSAWTLMLAGFGAIAWRLKQRRRDGFARLAQNVA